MSKRKRPTIATHRPAPGNLNLAPTLTLEAELPGPADLPDIPPVAPDVEVVASRITGYTGMEAHAHRLVAAGIEHAHVYRAMTQTRTRSLAVARLLTAVDAVLNGGPLGQLATARDRVMACAEAEVAR